MWVWNMYFKQMNMKYTFICWQVATNNAWITPKGLQSPDESILDMKSTHQICTFLRSHLIGDTLFKCTEIENWNALEQQRIDCKLFLSASHSCSQKVICSSLWTMINKCFMKKYILKIINHEITVSYQNNTASILQVITKTKNKICKSDDTNPSYKHWDPFS